MNTNIQSFFSNQKSKRILTISLITSTLVLIAITSQLWYILLSNDKIHDGVYVNKISAGGATRAELKNQLQKSLPDINSKTKLTINIGSNTYNLMLSDIEASYEIDTTIDRAFLIGHDLSIINRIRFLLKNNREITNINVPYIYSLNKLESYLDNILKNIEIKAIAPELIITDNKVSIKSGKKGLSFDKQLTLQAIDNALRSASLSSIIVPLIEIPAKVISIDEIYEKINQEPIDASVSVENNKLVYSKEVRGRKINKDTLTSIVKGFDQNQNIEKIIPVSFINPINTIDSLKSQVFKDNLFTFNTQFYTGNQNDANRGENIKLAVSKISGTVLPIGEIFSFNSIVGPRTDNEGYKVAHVYSGGEIVDDFGGGICQVSTTLYNTALQSDLEIIERTNHMFTVGYVPKGQDAAVAYDYVDFKFKNNTKYPLLIDGWVTDDNRLYFSLKGTKDSLQKSIEIVNNIIETLPFSTKYIDDFFIYEEDSYIKQEGMTGYVVDTYKIVRQNGKIIREDKLYTSIYNPLNREFVNGKKL